MLTECPHCGEVIDSFGSDDSDRADDIMKEIRSMKEEIENTDSEIEKLKCERQELYIN